MKKKINWKEFLEEKWKEDELIEWFNQEEQLFQELKRLYELED